MKSWNVEELRDHSEWNIKRQKKKKKTSGIRRHEIIEGEESLILGWKIWSSAEQGGKEKRGKRPEHQRGWERELTVRGERLRERDRALSHVTEQHVSAHSVNSFRLPFSPSIFTSIASTELQEASQPIRMQRLGITPSLSLSLPLFLTLPLWCDCVDPPTHISHLSTHTVLGIQLIRRVSWGFTAQTKIRI